jgi:hypothetical protein
MSIGIQLLASDFFIANSDIWSAYHAVRAWARQNARNTFMGDIAASADLATALACGWALTQDDAGNVTAITCSVSGSSTTRLKVMLDLFTPLAPFVRPGSVITLMHDDSNAALYEVTLFFTNGTVSRERRRVL